MRVRRLIPFSFFGSITSQRRFENSIPLSKSSSECRSMGSSCNDSDCRLFFEKIINCEFEGLKAYRHESGRVDPT